MYWRHVVASTLPERDEFVQESVGSEAYQTRHSGLLAQGFSFSGFERDMLWLNESGKMVDVSALSGADDDNDGRALCIADFDNDGDPDMFVHNIQRSRHHLYRNNISARTGHHHLKLLLEATPGRAEPVGAVVRVERLGRTTAQVLSYGSGFVSQNGPELIFGLGEDLGARVTVQWPGRALESFGELEGDRTFLLVEGTGEARPVHAKSFRFADPAPSGVLLGMHQRPSSLPVLDGERRAKDLLEMGRGSPMLVSFWATYCASCVAELPELQRWHEQGGRKVFLVNVDPPESWARAAEILEQRAPGLTTCFWTEALMADAIDPTQLPLPTTLFLDAQGKLVEVSQGPLQNRVEPGADS